LSESPHAFPARPLEPDFRQHFDVLMTFWDTKHALRSIR
jgi:hypothetical protein